MTSPIILRGELLADAAGRISRDGVAALTLEVRTGQAATTDADTVTALVTKVYGTGNAAAAARDARLRQLKRGVRVVIEGRGRISGRRLVLTADDIRTPDVFDPRLLAAGT